MQLEQTIVTTLNQDTQTTSEHGDPNNHFQSVVIVKEVVTYFPSLSIPLFQRNWEN